MKTGALKQRKNATATIRSGNDDCRDVRKISISQRYHAAMSRKSGYQFTTGGNIH